MSLWNPLGKELLTSLFPLSKVQEKVKTGARNYSQG